MRTPGPSQSVRRCASARRSGSTSATRPPPTPTSMPRSGMHWAGTAPRAPSCSPAMVAAGSFPGAGPRRRSRVTRAGLRLRRRVLRGGRDRAGRRARIRPRLHGDARRVPRVPVTRAPGRRHQPRRSRGRVVDEALEFYGRIFDVKLRGRVRRMAFVDLGDQFVALARGRTSRPTPTATSGSWWTTRRQPARAPGGGRRGSAARQLRFRDPWGNTVEVVDYRDVQFTKARACFAAWASMARQARGRSRRVARQGSGLADYPAPFADREREHDDEHQASPSRTPPTMSER